MRAVTPVLDGHVDRDGAQVFFEVYGVGSPTIFLLMPDTIVHSRAWKAQVPYLARTHRVVVIDPRGNGRSSAPVVPEGYAERALIDDAWAVLDRVGAERAVLIGLCTGAGHAVVMAAERPDRVEGVCAINPGLPLTPPHPHKVAHDFDAVLDTEEGWARLNRHYWRRDWRGFAGFFFDQMLPEPHSTKQWEDAVDWATTTTVDTMLCAEEAPGLGAPEVYADLCRRVECPVLVVTGSEDRCQPPERGRIVSELTGCELVELEGSGHLPQARDPVRVNLLLDDFVRRVAGGGATPAR
jgi:pimeloyl-ACP methyl ester carboxylesterase